MIDPGFCRAMARYNRWQNTSLMTAADALGIINELARQSFIEEGSGNIRDLSTVNLNGFRFFDASGDHRITALDALQVINQLARTEPAASGEAVAVAIAEEDDDSATRVLDPPLPCPSKAAPQPPP